MHYEHIMPLMICADNYRASSLLIHSYSPHLDILVAFCAAYQQLVVGPQSLPIKLSQQDHLWSSQTDSKDINGRGGNWRK